MFYFDSSLLIIIPGLILAMIAQAMVSGNFRKYEKIRARSGFTGAQMAQQMLADENIHDVAIERTSGQLTDHYDPQHKVLRLSDGVVNSDSIAALGIAAHETGHVLQHRDGYGALMVRTAIVPMVNISSTLSWPLFLVGLLASWEPLLWAGIILFSLAVVFSLVTLPVEFNASSRAMAILEGDGYLQGEELDGARKVLRAAALTYVASALTSILQLLRLLAISGVGRRRD